MNKRWIFLFGLMSCLIVTQAEQKDSTRITYKIPAKVKVNNAFGTPEIKQTSSDIKSTPTGKAALWDSLENANITLSLQKDSLINITLEQETHLKSAEAQMQRLTEENKNLNDELTNANGDRLQSSHTNSILYIFSVILGIIMLIALVWMTGKKKLRDTEKSYSNGFTINGSQEVYAPIPALDHRLERIEKLGNLRDKGLLTEEEFNLQKKQILSERS